jgi:hypothetical protein
MRHAKTGPGVDRLEDIHKLSFGSDEVCTFILADALEHVSDPLRAMREIHRCLRGDGVGGERSKRLGRETPVIIRVTIDRKCITEFPHTICGVAAKNEYDVAAIKAVAHRGCDIKTTAPLIIEGRAARIIHRLVTKLVPAKSTPSGEISAGFDKFARPGWCSSRVNGWPLGRAGECA